VEASSTSPHLALQHQLIASLIYMPSISSATASKRNRGPHHLSAAEPPMYTKPPESREKQSTFMSGSEWRRGVDQEEGADQEEARESSMAQARHGCRCGASMIKTRWSSGPSKAQGGNTEGMRRGTTGLVGEDWSAFLQNWRRESFSGRRKYNT
jgi:hypothetical protein